MRDRKPPEDLDPPEMGVVGAQFSPKLVYLGLAMIVLLLANTFLASQKSKLQAEIERQNQVIAELRQQLAFGQGQPVEREDSALSSD